ncbi:hypothetical protein XAB3213_4960010 [Xanthomonas citri pv. bilvae]|nr:hypothetical protein XAB3213_4960010 [Xanthomonas citri pv. bilvae]
MRVLSCSCRLQRFARCLQRLNIGFLIDLHSEQVDLNSASLNHGLCLLVLALRALPEHW